MAARPARAIESVSGIFLGHTATQFWALPQTLDATFGDQSVEPHARHVSAGRMGVEQHDLADRVGAEEHVVVGLRFPLLEGVRPILPPVA